MQHRLVGWVMCFFLTSHAMMLKNHSAVGEEPAVAGVVEVVALKPEVQTAAWAQSWWMPRHEAKLVERDELEQVDLLWIGDSITHAFPDAGKEVWDRYYAKRNPFNIGFSGDRTEQVLWRLQHDEIKGLKPKVAILMIGTNNTGHRQDPPDETAAGVREIIKMVQESTPDTKILLLAVFPRGETLDDPLRKLNSQVNEILSQFPEEMEGVTYLDIADKYLDAEGKLSREIMPDLLHPNVRGYEIWAESIEPTLARLLGEKES